MSKDFAWQLFKNTGNVDAFMIMREIENSSVNCASESAVMEVFKNGLADVTSADATSLDTTSTDSKNI